MLRIAIIAPGSRGDVEPYLALARGLAKAGYFVRLISHQNYKDWVESHGIEFWPVEGNAQDIAQSTDMRILLERGNFLAILSQMAKEAQRGAMAFAKGGLAACQSMDLVLAGIGGLFSGLALAEKLGLPLLQAYYIPFTPTKAYPSFLLPPLPSWLGGLLNRPSYTLAQQMLWQSFRPADRLARREVLGMRTAPFWGAFHSDSLRGMPILYGYSPAVIPPPSDWDSSIHVTGYWFLEENADWAPPPALVEFLQSGPPPVYIGFGSMSNRDPEQFATLILDALAQTGQRAILLSGWGGLTPAYVPKSVLLVDSLPFAWLFPQMAAVVHHGGAGTTAAGLRAGVPSILVPFFGDQPYWGRRVADLGVGPEPIPRKKLSVERLAEAIRKAVLDEEMRQRADSLGAKIKAEDGVARAIEVIRGIEKVKGL